MNAEASEAVPASRAVQARPRTMVRALLWEEAWVGGAIAAWCSVPGLLLVAQNAIMLRNEDLANAIAVTVPALLALLLVFSADNTGHLIGGYSNRILRLPVPTYLTVAVTLTSRTLFIVAAAFMHVGLARLLHDAGPAWGAAIGLVHLYLFIQVLDWLRAPFSGLTSALLVVAVIGIPLAVIERVFLAESLEAAGATRVLAHPLTLLVLFPLAYAVAVPAVHAARIGWRAGLPEFWELPQHLDAFRRGRVHAFASPLHAQVWFDLRRNAWTFPLTALLIWVISGVMLWYLGDTEPGNADVFAFWQAIAVWPALFLGAFAYAVHAGPGGLRRPLRDQRYVLLQPATDTELAAARLLANAILLAIVLAAATALHFALGGRWFVTGPLLDAWQLGAASARETVWILISRAVLTALVLWPLLAAGTRMMVWALSGFVALCVVLALADGVVHVHIPHAPVWPLVWITAMTLGSYFRAWRFGLVGGRGISLWAGAWLVSGWLLTGPVPRAHLDSIGWTGHFVVFLTALGLAAVIPLPYAALLLEFRRHRHGGRVSAAPEAPPENPLFTPRLRKRLMATATAAALAAIWLGWPALPAYERFLRARGLPATPDELAQWYGTLPDDENAAVAYTRIAETKAVLTEAFTADPPPLPASNEPDGIPPEVFDYLYIVGNAELPRDGTFPAAQWVINEAYWTRVAAPVAEALATVSDGGVTKARYIEDISGLLTTESDIGHMRSVQDLARALYFDVLHSAVTGDTARAAESAAAIFAIVDTMAHEPLLIQQLVRAAIFGIGRGACETALRYAEFADADLSRMQQAVDAVLADAGRDGLFEAALVGEPVFARSMLELSMLEEALVLPKHSVNPGLLIQHLLYLYAAEEMLIASTVHSQETTISIPPGHRATFTPFDPKSATNLNVEYWFLTPTAPFVDWTLSSGLVSVEWRTRAELTALSTSLAIERYRAAEGALPDSLEALVPGYLEAVPMDPWAPPDTPLHYVPGEDGAFMVYSFGPNLRDDKGTPPDQGYDHADITSRVPPLAQRVGPHIAPAS